MIPIAIKSVPESSSAHVHLFFLIEKVSSLVSMEIADLPELYPEKALARSIT